MKRILNHLLFFSFFILLFSVTATTSTDFSQDLGRHLKLGEIIVNTGHIPLTNMFSYTFPQFPFINHHWLSEVIFFVLYTKVNPFTLSLLKICLVLSAFFVVIKTAEKKSDIVCAVISSFIFLPLFLDRNDIRPELFGYLFYAVFLYVFVSVKRINKYLFIIPAILLFWVNLHISFIFGVMLGLLMIVKLYIELLNHKKLNCHCEEHKRRSNPVEIATPSQTRLAMTCKYDNNSLCKLLLFMLSFFIVLINPNGINGALYPLRIFSNYGYPIVENQNVFFLSERISNHLVTYFFIISPVIIITIFYLIFRRKILESLLLTGMFSFSVFQIRHFPFLVLTVIPFASWMIHSLYFYIHKLFKKINLTSYRNSIILLFLFIISFLSFFFFDNSYSNTFDSDKRFGFGFEENEKEATDFILKHNLKGNVFNNFDIGGYLVYRFYPKYQLFIDNRPEAYPSDFVQNIYIHMQEKIDLQNSIFKKYDIKTVVFSHTDQTPWAQQFISRISQDNNWKLVFLNSRIIIFTQNTKLPDLRDNRLFFKKSIDKENSYLNLLRFSGIFNSLHIDDLANYAFKKAEKLGIDSCSIKRNIVMQMKNSIYFSQVDNYKRSSFWCF